ncbi:MAG: ABC transporter ATP-binding protein [Candidatus Brocadiae bacterium]|nr:ABC transporter ATP-binding protein [Candidatus Brocadiia bacterium]
MLALRNLSTGYGRLEVLHGISLEVREGEIVTLIGANGAGKSTTLNAICGLVRARAGSIELGGRDITRLPTNAIIRAGVAQSPEGRKLFSELTVLENLEMGAYLRSDSGAMAADFRRVFALFPILEERKHQAAGSLSGGEQQMCAIGRALMARPKLLLLDEPSLGLAPLVCQQIFEVIRGLNREGTTILLVEQCAHSALKLAHRAYVMETGTISLSGKACDLACDEKVKAAYLGE